MTCAAEGVELADLLGGERARRPVDLGVVPVGEGVLGVQLDLVDLERGETVDQRVQGLGPRDLVAGDVEHHPAHLEVGVVADHADGDRAVVEAGELGEGGLAVEKPRLVGAGQLHPRIVDAQEVALRRQGRIHPVVCRRRCAAAHR